MILLCVTPVNFINYDTPNHFSLFFFHFTTFTSSWICCSNFLRHQEHAHGSSFCLCSYCGVNLNQCLVSVFCTSLCSVFTHFTNAGQTFGKIYRQFCSFTWPKTQHEAKAKDKIYSWTQSHWTLWNLGWVTTSKHRLMLENYSIFIIRGLFCIFKIHWKLVKTQTYLPCNSIL